MPLPRVLQCILFFIGLLFTRTVYCQSDDDSVLYKFKKFRENNLQEKLFVHTDRTFYLTGEYIWLKIYCVDGIEHKPLSISSIAYVELIDHNNTSIVQAKIKLQDGKGHSSLFLPASLNSGNYTFRAYTRWMKNYSSDFYFHKTITIVNTFKPLEAIPVRERNEQYDVQFFPEGGQLVNGINSKVAFRVVDRSGRGVSCIGHVLNSKGDTLVRFTPLRFGIGTFKFTPSVNTLYTAVITDTLHRTIAKKTLPPANAQGYTMNVSQHDNKVSIVVNSTLSEHARVRMLVHTRNKIIAYEKQFLRNNQAAFILDANSFLDGVSHITIFDPDNNPVCERLYFKRPGSTLEIKAVSSHSKYDHRTKVNIEVRTLLKNMPAASEMSASVYRIDSLQSEDPMRIDNFLMLTSELKGNIESPDYYFGNSDDVDAVADNLMLTHGWRRFIWPSVLTSKSTVKEFYPEYRVHTITGKIERTDKETTKTPIPLYLSIPARNFIFKVAKSNRMGDFNIEVPDFYGNVKMVLQTNTTMDSLYTLTLKEPFSDKRSDYKPFSFELTAKSKNQLLSRSISMQLMNAYFHKHIRSIENPQRDTTAFYWKPNKTYYLDDYTRFSVMEDVMREYVPDVFVRKRNDNYFYYVINANEKNVFRDNTLVLLDGIPVFDINKIMQYDPLKIRQLDIVTHRFFYGPLTFHGIVSYQSYEGNFPGFEVDPRAIVTAYEGIQHQREFFSPMYETQDQVRSRTPDHRNLLYWSPVVTSDKSGKGYITFYTGDLPGQYVLVMQGLTKEGYLGSSQFVFTVTPN